MIYLDNAATTNIDPEVLDAMMPYLTDQYGNPSSLYGLGQKAKIAIENAREIIAKTINADPEDIFFTSGGSESNNWVLKCFDRYSDIITTSIEHPSILNTCKILDYKPDVDVYYLDVDSDGFVDVSHIEQYMHKPNTLVSIMMVNNEIGTIQDIGRIGDLLQPTGAYFHTDAVQAYGHLQIDVEAMNIDYLSVSGHKIHAPKGVGFLYAKGGYLAESLINGGHQEFGMRAGTENVASIVGLGKAAELAYKNLDVKETLIKERRNYFIHELYKTIPEIKLNGSWSERLNNNINVYIKGIRGEELVSLLDQMGICISSGSACSSGNGKPSHVLKAIGLTDEEANSSVRLTIGLDITIDDIDKAVKDIKTAVELLRGR